MARPVYPRWRGELPDCGFFDVKPTVYPRWRGELSKLTYY